MARKTKTPEQARSPVPDYIKETRTYQRKRVSKRKLPSFEEAMLLLHVPEMARLYFEAIFGGLKERDKTSLEHAGEILNFVQRKGININVAQQMMQQHVAAGEQAPVIGSDAFIRRLHEARTGLALPAPAEVIDLQLEAPVAAGQERE